MAGWPLVGLAGSWLGWLTAGFYVVFLCGVFIWCFFVVFLLGVSRGGGVTGELAVVVGRLAAGWAGWQLVRLAGWLLRGVFK